MFKEEKRIMSEAENKKSSGAGKKVGIEKVVKRDGTLAPFDSDKIYNAINKKFSTEQEFKDYLVENTPQNLDEVLGDWDAVDKGRFFTNNQSALGANNCFFFGQG